MLGGGDELIAILRETPVILRAVVAGLDDERARATSEGWSVIETIGHLVDVEERATARIALIVGEDRPVLDGFDQAAMVEQRGYQQQRLSEVVQAFEALRSRRLAALEALTPTDWEREGIWSETGEALSLRNITIHLCWHDVAHIAQIARLASLHGRDGGAAA